ncbi:MAG: hypothetical protein HYX29_01830 [Solirubrobacterales bacterium]|nr:hypothetical protein [Solirubrobacterales bacterium]
MGTGVRVPSRVAAISVGVLWGKKHRDPQPELLPVTQIGVAILQSGSITDRYTLASEELLGATERLLKIDAPLLAFTALRFDWLSLGSLVDVSPLIPRTIDIYSALYPCVADLVDAEGVSGFPMRGDYGVLNPYRLAETNLGYVPGASDDALGDAELAAEMWLHLIQRERAVIAGRTHALSDDSLAMLRGDQPAFESAAAWRELIAARPEPKPHRRKTRHQVTFPRIDQRYP